MNRKRWIYVGVLGVASVAFIVDRLFLGTPETAEAKPAAQTPKAARPTAASKKPQGQPVVVDPSLAWLEKLAEPGTERDVFAPSPEWLARSKAEAAEAAAAAEREKGPQPGSPRAFEEAHKLQATTVMGQGGLAVVDGQCLSVGETLDGFRLARVEAGQVEFRRGADRVTLTLPMPPAPSAKRPMPAGPSPDDIKTATTPTTRPASGWGLLRRLWSR
jgi:hypothetical protein